MDDAASVPELDEVEQRVIASLLEKQVTVPASYPMTIAGLVTACNQASSRDPVTDHDEATVLAALDRLKERGLARLVHPSHGVRSLKYRQVFDERFQLSPPQRALLTVLLARGPQSAGELKTRTQRLHGFGDRGEVEACLGSMASRSAPLVAHLPARPGQHDPRWIHTFGSGPSGAVADPSSQTSPSEGVLREDVLRDGVAERDRRVRETYDGVAPDYAEQLLDELDAKPFDRWLLERIVSLAGSGPIADVGCGPGQVAAHLSGAGGDVVGYDVAPAMVAQARARFAGLRFEVEDLRSLPGPHQGAQGWAALVCWYSLVHLAESELEPTIDGLSRLLHPGGVLAVAVHEGEEVRHLEQWWDRDVDIDFVFHDGTAVRSAFERAGLVAIEWYRRGPIADAESETDRFYILGRRPQPIDDA